MSVFHGLFIGNKYGPIFGSSFTSGGMAGVNQDVSSGKFTPSNLTQWNTTMAAAGIGSGSPSLLWLCQEPSGNLTDSIGTFTGTVTGTPVTYNSAVAGWTRTGILGADAGTGVAENTAAGLPDPATQSVLLLTYAIITAAPAAIRVMQVTGNANQTIARFNTTPRLQGVSGGSVVTGTANPLGSVRPYITMYDITNNRVVVASDQEKLIVTRAAMTGKRHRLAFNFTGTILYHAAWFGAAAELSDAQLKTLLQTLNWSIPWT